MKKEHPILFSTPMVQAILEGRKTQTRRILKPKPIANEIVESNQWKRYTHVSRKEIIANPGFYEIKSVHKCPYGETGDLLWVRETFTEWPKGEFQFRASTRSGDELGKWKPSIHMPKVAARIWLEITEVKVERLQDISYADAKAEGVELPHNFYELWVKINGYESWMTNPWVWVVKFKVLTTTGKPSFDFAQDDKTAKN
jgi:hypothetical protein